MPVIPPWQAVNPLDFIKAAEAGGALGNQRAANLLRAQEISNQAREAGGRIGLGYAEMNARSQQAAAAQAAEREMAAARLKQEQAQMESMNNYRALLEQNRLRDDARAAEALKNREAYEQMGLGLRATQGQDTEKYHAAMIDLAEKRNALEEKRLDKPSAAEARANLFRSLAGIGSPTNAPPAGGAMPGMPATGGLPPPDQLEKGKTYNVPGYGPGTWDGTNFILADPNLSAPGPARKPTIYMGPKEGGPSADLFPSPDIWVNTS